MMQVEERRVEAVNRTGETSGTEGMRREPARGWETVARSLMPVAAGVFAVYLLIGVGMAARWPLVHDAPLMHYVVFAMDQGQAPYRDIVEMNMPGTYVIERAAMHVLGGDAFGWWLWDALLGLAAVLASVWIAGTGRRSAGVMGGAMAYLFHLSDGAWNLGQRDWTVAVLLLVGFGCLFAALRGRQPVWMAGFTCFCGLAASIKPPVLGIAVAFAAGACWVVARWNRGAMGAEARRGWLGFGLWAGAGLAIPAVMVAVFLLQWGITKDFVQVLHGLVPYYASLQRMSVGRLIVASFHLKPLLLSAFVVFALGRCWRRWESDLLLLAAAAGAALFVVQGKGWDYHLYPELAFALLWAAVEFQGALERSRPERAIAGLAVVLTLCVFGPRRLWAEHLASYPMETVTALQRDLTALGGAELSGKVQCLDMTLGGCINVLYRMQLGQSTGFIYDFYLFPEKGTAVTRELHGRFLREVTAKPPELIVLSSQAWPGDARGYAQLGHWSAFQEYLEGQYSVVREFPEQAQSAGYRIYRLRAAEGASLRP